MFTTLITTSQLHQQLNSKNWVIIDCRFSLADTESGSRDYLKAHIPNAHYLHLDRDLSGKIIKEQTGRHPLPTVSDFVTTIESIGIKNDTQIVVYDQGHGGIAARLWWMMNWLGHENVAVLDGGWVKWQQENLPTDHTIPIANTSNFIPNENHSLIATVENNALHSDFSELALIVDARTAPRYQGINEPIDPIAGHIPNAINAPFLENLRNGQFLPIKELQARFEKILNATKVENTVFYCGSGVTACHNILALRHIGLGMAKLYPGSWSHWITDSNRSIMVENR